MRKVVPSDVFGTRRERQRQEEAHRRGLRPYTDGAFGQANAAQEREPQRREKEKERQQVIDYWLGKGFELVRFADGEAVELQGSEGCYVLVTGRHLYELPATLQAQVSVSFHMPDGRMARSCAAINSEEAFTAITRIHGGDWVHGERNFKVAERLFDAYLERRRKKGEQVKVLMHPYRSGQVRAMLEVDGVRLRVYFCETKEGWRKA